MVNQQAKKKQIKLILKCEILLVQELFLLLLFALMLSVFSVKNTNMQVVDNWIEI